ncbi:MAG: hypothetical protein KIS96_03050 [Bauldia sp.]|nr:hypothetical protein [Bauldia sp.]
MIGRLGQAVVIVVAVVMATASPAQEEAVQGVVPGGGWSALVPLRTAPFPYAGPVPDTGAPFLDVERNGRLGHASSRGGVYWEDETYSDRRSLLYVPPDFDPGRPGVMVVFFHGNNSTLGRDVIARQQVPAQVANARANAVLLAPQFAIDALDSSAGRFWQRGAFATYLGEAADQFAALIGRPGLAATFGAMPVVLVAYSGGYLPAAYVLSQGGADGRLCGALLLDAVYGEVERFAGWVAARGNAFLVSAYTDSSADGNAGLRSRLQQRGIGYATTLPAMLQPGSVTFRSVAADHGDLVTRAWTPDPITWVLDRLPAGGCGS